MLSVDVSDKPPLPLECYNNASVLQCSSNDETLESSTDSAGHFYKPIGWFVSNSGGKEEEQCKKDKQHEKGKQYGQEGQQQQRGRPILGTGARHQNNAGSQKTAGGNEGEVPNPKWQSYNKNKNKECTGV